MDVVMSYWMFLPLAVILIAVIVYCSIEVHKLLKEDFGFSDISALDPGPISKKYNTEDIFHDIEGDDNNVLMTIPEEVCKAANLQPGDTISVEQVNGTLVIKKV